MQSTAYTLVSQPDSYESTLDCYANMPSFKTLNSEYDSKDIEVFTHVETEHLGPFGSLLSIE